jgi:hypothetical protein
MDLNKLVRALRNYDTIAARQWVADAKRSGIQLRDLAKPSGLDPIDNAIAAGVVELLSTRWGQTAPKWTGDIAAAPVPVFLVRAAKLMPRLRKACETEGPESLRRRRILAPPDFLTAA